MYVEVAAIVTPKHQAYIRSAGSKGADAYEEVVAQGRALYVEHTNCGEDAPHHAPITLPIVEDALGFNNTTTLVVHHSHLVDMDVALGDLDVHPIRHIRYLGVGVDVLPSSNQPETFKYSRVSTIEMLEFEYAIAIQDSFLCGMSRLTAINLSSLRNVTTIGNMFLCDCTSLTSLDISPLHNVTEVGSMFLFGCIKITSIDFTALNKLSKIGAYFMGDCQALTTITFPTTPTAASPTTASGEENDKMISSSGSTSGSGEGGIIGSVGDGFMSGCDTLANIDISILRNATKLGDLFLSRCSSLTTIDLSPLRNVITIGDYFMSECGGLTSVDLGPLENVEEVGMYLFDDCISLLNVDLSPLSLAKTRTDGGNEEDEEGN